MFITYNFPLPPQDCPNTSQEPGGYHPVVHYVSDASLASRRCRSRTEYDDNVTQYQEVDGSDIRSLNTESIIDNVNTTAPDDDHDGSKEKTTGPAMTGNTSGPVDQSDLEGITSIARVLHAEEHMPARRCTMYCMHAVRSRRQAASMLSGMVFDEEFHLQETDVDGCGVGLDNGGAGEGKLQPANGALMVDQVDGGEFGARLACGEAGKSARGEAEEISMGVLAKEARRLEGKGKLRGVALLLGLARQL
ncbi:hypothetical protein FOMPIDRAFT_1045980 [Fomitopsis schrenkii]|uniref:Uncharacterized protein n=1 Tax=Fomitopsis schrenkii TaxID=2126942 RepID=S8G389_FOMSC|nr:hypothetical protein FOMPIDRAFT_1045980 [Fomitopsis schrenkii]